MTSSHKNIQNTFFEALKGNLPQRYFPVQKTSYFIGRGSANDLNLPGKGTPGAYACLSFAQGGWYIRELQNVGKISVNGQRIQAARLKDGDVIEIEEYRFVFRQQFVKAPSSFPTAPPVEIKKKERKTATPFLVGVSVLTVIVIGIIAISYSLDKSTDPTQFQAFSEVTPTIEPPQATQPEPTPEPTNEPTQQATEETDASSATIIIDNREITILPADISSPDSLLLDAGIQMHQQGEYLAIYISPDAASNLASQYFLIRPERLDDMQQVFLIQEEHATLIDDVEFDPDLWNEIATATINDSLDKIIRGNNYDFVFFSSPNARGRIKDSTLHFYESPFPGVLYVWVERPMASRGIGVLAAPARVPEKNLVNAIGIHASWQWWLSVLGDDLYFDMCDFANAGINQKAFLNAIFLQTCLGYREEFPLTPYPDPCTADLCFDD